MRDNGHSRGRSSNGGLGLSKRRVRWLVELTGAVGRTVGPPESLLTAIDDVKHLRAIGLPYLAALWTFRGRTSRPLHPDAVTAIARSLFGIDTGWNIMRRDRWRRPLVTPITELQGVLATARRLERALRTSLSVVTGR